MKKSIFEMTGREAFQPGNRLTTFLAIGVLIWCLFTVGGAWTFCFVLLLEILNVAHKILNILKPKIECCENTTPADQVVDR